MLRGNKAQSGIRVNRNSEAAAAVAASSQNARKDLSEHFLHSFPELVRNTMLGTPPTRRTFLVARCFSPANNYKGPVGQHNDKFTHNSGSNIIRQ